MQKMEEGLEASSFYNLYDVSQHIEYVEGNKAKIKFWLISLSVLMKWKEAMIKWSTSKSMFVYLQRSFSSQSW